VKRKKKIGTGTILLVVGLGIAALVAYGIYGGGLHGNSPIAPLMNKLAGITPKPQQRQAAMAYYY
jgi:hypothetical protein